MKEYYTVNEIADILGRHRNTIILYIKSGRLRAIKPGKIYLIPKEELDKFLIIAELKARRGFTTKQAEKYLERAMKEVTEKEDTFIDLMQDTVRAFTKVEGGKLDDK